MPFPNSQNTSSKKLKEKDPFTTGTVTGTVQVSKINSDSQTSDSSSSSSPSSSKVEKSAIKSQANSTVSSCDPDLNDPKNNIRVHFSHHEKHMYVMGEKQRNGGKFQMTEEELD